MWKLSVRKLMNIELDHIMAFEEKSTDVALIPPTKV